MCNNNNSPYEMLGAFALCFIVGVATCYASIKTLAHMTKSIREKTEAEFKTKEA